MTQRNALLKETWCCREMLGAWNESIARAGSALLVHRLALLDRLSGHVRDAYGRVASGEPAGVSYVSTLGDLPRTEDRDELRGWAYEHMLSALDERADEEIRRGVTLVGPHRDEIEFSVAGRSARSFASQGQQRTLVLAWKVAEVAVARDILGTAPLLLLDDVMSELDAARRRALVAFISGDIQTFITTTNLAYFDDDLLGGARIVELEKPRVTSETPGEERMFHVKYSKPSNAATASTRSTRERRAKRVQSALETGARHVENALEPRWIRTRSERNSR